MLQYINNLVPLGFLKTTISNLECYITLLTHIETEATYW